MDAKTHHLFKPVMIGRITDDGRILPVSVTEGLVPPEPWSPWLKRQRRRRQAPSAADSKPLPLISTRRIATFRKIDADQYRGNQPRYLITSTNTLERF